MLVQHSKWNDGPNGCLLWSEEEFKSRLRVQQEKFEVILVVISPFITKTPTNFNQMRSKHTVNLD